jgi:hypothetical protein
MKDLAWQQQHVIATKGFDTEVYDHLLYGKLTMDEIRGDLNAMQDAETLLLTNRVQEVNAIRQRDYLAIILALCIGLGSRLIARAFSKRKAPRQISTLNRVLITLFLNYHPLYPAKSTSTPSKRVSTDPGEFGGTPGGLAKARNDRVLGNAGENTLAAKILRGWIGAEAARDIHRCHFLAMRGSGRPQVDEDHRHLPLDARFPLGICQPK